jgi:hypothetical protein
MSLGAVTKHLFDLIAKQVEDYSLVVWYDPEKPYPGVASKTTLARYDGSFIKLREVVRTFKSCEP